MAKKINEKTFELNITNELLNLSKSFLWYLDHSPICHLHPRRAWADFLNQSVLFAEGLTQEQENDPATGGYDVSINYTLPNEIEGRLMFLQYKAGIRKKYSNKTASNFFRQTARLNGRTPEHVMFTFNDAAEGVQHSTLRNLANRAGIQSQSVMYVFPRITEKTDFNNKVGSLIYNSSFVPVIELDSQASNQTPPILINDGYTHKYRTSYDGLTSEVNFFFFFFFYDDKVISQLLSELICIQIERVSKILIKQEKPFLDMFLDFLSTSINRFVEYELKLFPSKDIIIGNVNSYIKKVEENLRSSRTIPNAPSQFTTIIPRDGLKLKFDDKNDFSPINYQLF